MDGSYHINHFSSNTDSEVEPLQGQMDLFFEKEFNVYQEIGLHDGMDIIECGCGPGDLLFRILEKQPGCRVTGLEIDPLLYKLLEENIKNLDCPDQPVQASITETGLKDDPFDLIISRLVFEYIPDPISALKELYRISKPVGKLIIFSNDFKMHLITFPAIDELDEMFAACCQSRIDEGGNPYIGRKLPGLLQQNRFSNISFNIVGAHSQIDDDKAYLKSEDVNISRNLVQQGKPEQLHITAGGNANQYQWQKNNIDIEEATDDSLELNSLSLEDSGLYHSHIRNSMVSGLILASRACAISFALPADDCY